MHPACPHIPSQSDEFPFRRFSPQTENCPAPHQYASASTPSAALPDKPQAPAHALSSCCNPDKQTVLPPTDFHSMRSGQTAKTYAPRSDAPHGRNGAFSYRPAHPQGFPDRRHAHPPGIS